jgi:hypothetical protein
VNHVGRAAEEGLFQVLYRGCTIETDSLKHISELSLKKKTVIHESAVIYLFSLESILIYSMVDNVLHGRTYNLKNLGKIFCKYAL